MNNNIHNKIREQKQSLRHKLSDFKAQTKQQWLDVCKFLIQFLLSFRKSPVVFVFKQTSCSTENLLHWKSIQRRLEQDKSIYSSFNIFISLIL